MYAELVSLRRVAVFGQALLLVEGRAREWEARPNDVAAALRRLVTPTPEQQKAAIAARDAGASSAG